MRVKNTVRFFASLSLFVLLSACSQHMVRDLAASGMVNFGNKYVNPWFMASEDTDVMCSMGEGMAAMTFPLGPNVDPMIPMLTLASGNCADERSKEEELRYIRAVRKNDVESAQDARTMQKRWLSLSARRLYFGYQASVRHFGVVADECPEFKNRDAEMSFLFGQLVGIQAVQADMGSGGVVGVPPETLPNALRGIQCLDSDTYWGIPEAVGAMATIMTAKLDNEKTQLAQGYAKLEHASQQGKSQGVRMVQLLEATIYMTQGDEEKTKKVIRDHVETKSRVPPDPALKLLDEMATRGLTLISDKLWTENTGQRTPYNSLGKFWDDSAIADDSLDIDDVL